MSDDVEHQPWDRQPGESAQAHRAFNVYRMMGKNRSLAAAVDRAGFAPSTRKHWAHWSSTHNWQARVAAWDEHLRKIVDKAHEERVGEMATRHAELAQALQSAITLPLNELSRRLTEKEIDLTQIPLPDLLRMMRELGPVTKHAVDIERVSRGQPSDRLEVGSPAEMQEVERLRELVRKHQAQPGPEPPTAAAAAGDDDQADA